MSTKPKAPTDPDNNLSRGAPADRQERERQRRIEERDIAVDTEKKRGEGDR